MSRIGMENIPENIDERYSKEEKEFLVMCISGSYGAELGDYCEIIVDIIGHVETATGNTSSLKSCITYTNEKFEYLFSKEKIYRIKGRLSESSDDIYVTEIISDNEKNDFLENLLTEYRKEVSVNSEVLGKLILNKDLNQYRTENDIEWCGGKTGFYINADNDDINEFLPVAEEFYKNRREWDRKARKYASEQLTEIAVDWQYQGAEDDEEVVEITEKEFAERLIINDISFNSDGNFKVYYSDDDMFWGHSILVDGNINTGFESAYI